MRRDIKILGTIFGKVEEIIRGSSSEGDSTDPAVEVFDRWGLWNVAGGLGLCFDLRLLLLSLSLA